MVRPSDDGVHIEAPPAQTRNVYRPVNAPASRTAADSLLTRGVKLLVGC